MKRRLAACKPPCWRGGGYFVLFLPGAVAGGALGWFLIRPVNWLLGKFFQGFNWVFDRATSAYGRTVGWALRFSVIVLLIYVGLIGLTGFGFTHVPAGFIPSQDKGRLFINIQLPDSASLERTVEVTEKVGKIARETPGIAHTIGNPGRSFVLNIIGSNLSTIFVPLKPFSDRRDPALSADAIAAQLRRQNPSLRAAGVRVLEAQAQRGIAIGELFPQQQDSFGTYSRNDLSENKANRNTPGLKTPFDDWQIGFEASWELDVWGRFRRAIESADATLLASVATYDDVLVSLVAQVATTYLQLRILQERLAVATANVVIQARGYDIANAKFQGGTATELDAAQAASLLQDTQAQIPALETSIRQTQNTLCTLLGIPPQDLQSILGGQPTVPTPPAEVAVGIPADLLRRRPDIRQAERGLAAQSAQIGIAKTDLLPSFALLGTLSLSAEKFADLFQSNSFENFGGPSFRWAILNYGRIQNNVRVQDARFQALIGDYENTVLRAQEEVESAIAGYLGAQRQVVSLTGSVASAARAVELADFQYREGAADYTRVLTAQQFLVGEQDRLVTTKGSVALNLVSLYRALGGGWEWRAGKDFVSDRVKMQMQERTNWGAMLSTEGQAKDIGAASSGTEGDQSWWRWRLWGPKW